MRGLISLLGCRPGPDSYSSVDYLQPLYGARYPGVFVWPASINKKVAIMMLKRRGVGYMRNANLTGKEREGGREGSSCSIFL